MDKKHIGNIKPEHQFDLFPKNGLTKQFEPFIRKEVEKYCQSYQHVPRLDMLGEAVRLSVAAEARFKPALGIRFAHFSPTGFASCSASPRGMMEANASGSMRTPKSRPPG